MLKVFMAEEYITIDWQLSSVAKDSLPLWQMQLLKLANKSIIYLINSTGFVKYIEVYVYAMLCVYIYIYYLFVNCLNLLYILIYSLLEKFNLLHMYKS